MQPHCVEQSVKFSGLNAMFLFGRNGFEIRSIFFWEFEKSGPPKIHSKKIIESRPSKDSRHFCSPGT